ncbi:MotA/TolQ/ExbB proton channel family protein [Acidovorax radicis]|uniref:MotA/TolQ/ExbB proton channel family protein n=1 Tax=Acidovorax radicis TaxID=758826 RepID=UPI00299E3F0E|nr:MotA/TolQ/ExbB proton channel family protein [Acidovorax radicis]UCV01000.1 MotA/TolQ/ExbB proton channel family protein [Acidovorax radicis]
MNDSMLGFPHFLGQADVVARFILGFMLVASVVTWGLIVDRLIDNFRVRRQSQAFLARFHRAINFPEAIAGLSSAADVPCTRLVYLALDSVRHYDAHDASHIDRAGGLSEFLTRVLRQGIEDEAQRMERGLTVLASVGSTAPFVGLLGTVWGIYHALLAIGISGQGTLDKVAGPVGEALIMTAIGLAVAIPAVLGYNALGRRNRVALCQLDAFGHDVLTMVVTGAPLVRSTPGANSIAPYPLVEPGAKPLHLAKAV